MDINVGPTGPVTCSKCGSTNAVNPVNSPNVLIRCLDCGHEKRKPPPPDPSLMETYQSISNTPPERNEF